MVVFGIKNKAKLFAIAGLAVLIVVGALILYLQAYANRTKKISWLKSRISFNLPYDLAFSALDDNAGILDKIIAQNNESNRNNKYEGIKVTYYTKSPWTPSIENIPFSGDFKVTAKTKKLESDSLLKKDSAFSSDQITMYTYLDGDAIGHNRGKYGSVHQGDVRLDFETADHAIYSEAVFFQCKDTASKDKISQRCADILNIFLNSLRLENATLLSSPPSFEQSNYFEKIESKKRQFKSDEKISLYSLDMLPAPDMYYPYFSATADAELLDLPDKNLRSMKCMPQQIYLGQSGHPYYSLEKDRSYPIYSFRTADSNNLFHEIKIADPQLLKLAVQLEQYARNNGAELTNFLACETQDELYVVKYNRRKLAVHSPGAQSVEYENEKSIIAEVGLMDRNGNMLSKASVPLPKTKIYCEKPLALTIENIFYFGCNIIEQGATYNNYNLGQNIYKVDLNNQTHALLSQCSASYKSRYRTGVGDDGSVLSDLTCN